MKYKKSSIPIWFLYDDVSLSCKSLTDKTLKKSIWNIINILIAVRFYYIGIRKQKFYKYFFDKSHKDITLQQYFCEWPFKKLPSFSLYTNNVSKWARLGQHYDYILLYLEQLSNEYQYRFKKQSDADLFLQWEKYDAPKINLVYSKNDNFKLVFPWKVLSLKYRNIDICLGYRNQYAAILKNFKIKITDFTNRDIPEFLIDLENIWLN